MKDYSKDAENLGKLAVALVFGLGIALYLGSTLYTALPVNSVAAVAVNSIIGGFSSAITTVLVPVISILFILFLYMVAKKAGLLGSGKE